MRICMIYVCVCVCGLLHWKQPQEFFEIILSKFIKARRIAPLKSASSCLSLYSDSKLFVLICMIDVCECVWYALGWHVVGYCPGRSGGVTPRAPVVSYAQQFEFPLYFSCPATLHAFIYMSMRVCACMCKSFWVWFITNLRRFCFKRIFRYGPCR